MNFEVQTFIRKWVSSCARCRSLRGPIHIYCEYCWLRLFEIQNAVNDFQQRDYPFLVYALFTWQDELDQLIRPLVYALKGGVIVEPWMKFAQDFLFFRSQIGNLLPQVIVIPPQKKRLDHAYYWGKALADSIGCELLLCLAETNNTRKQKLLSRESRQKKEFELEGDFKKDHFRELRIAFVDDTITTGSTAAAAFQALEGPCQFEVWTLVAKPRFGTA